MIAPGGVYAGVTVTSGDGVTLSSGGSKVVLRNLAITGVGGMNGINDLAAADLYIQDCTISGFIVGLGSGVLYSSATSYSGGNLVDISHSTFRENTYAVHISPANQFLLETTNIDNSDLVSNFYGVYFDPIGHIQATITRSRLTHNYTDGLYQTNATTGDLTVTQIESSVIAGNLYDGIVADDAGGFSFVRVSNSVVVFNGDIGVRPINGGGIYSRGNNTVQDNGADGTFTGMYAPK